jgi:hypothetical protein
MTASFRGNNPFGETIMKPSDMNTVQSPAEPTKHVNFANEDSTKKGTKNRLISFSLSEPNSESRKENIKLPTENQRNRKNKVHMSK